MTDSYSNSTGPMDAKQERNWAVIMHLSPLAGYFIPFAGFIIPLVVWLLKRNESVYLDNQGKEVVNFLISVSIALMVCIPLCFILIGIPLLMIIGLGAFTLTIIASVKTSNGENYRYPFILRLIK